MRMSFSRSLLVAGSLLTVCWMLAACDLDGKADDNNSYPKTEEDRRRERIGKMSGDEGIVIGGPKEKQDDAGKNPLGVNSFLWRATLDTLSFLPLASADPWGGVVITDWYEDPAAKGERFKVNALILDRQLRADNIKISVFRQKQDKTGKWVDAAADTSLSRKLEDTILTRARQLRIAQLGR